MQALLRIPKARRREVAREWAKRSHAPGGARDRARMERGIDFETERKRALDDRRGSLIEEGRDWLNGRERHWVITHSLRGRTNQVDLAVSVLGAATWQRTGSLRTARHAVKFGVWRAA